MYSLGIDIGGTKCAVILGKGELSDNIENFIIDKIKFPSIDNICSFIDEIVFTKELQLTLDEVLFFMNINVDEKMTEPIASTKEECIIEDEFDFNEPCCCG